MSVKTKTMEERAVTALVRTWDAIGYDALQCMVDAGEVKNINQAVMTRAEVIDMVTSCGFVGGYPMQYGDDKEAVKWLEVQTDEVLKPIYKKAFPLARYGM